MNPGRSMLAGDTLCDAPKPPQPAVNRTIKAALARAVFFISNRTACSISGGVMLATAFFPQPQNGLHFDTTVNFAGIAECRSPIRRAGASFSLPAWTRIRAPKATSKYASLSTQKWQQRTNILLWFIHACICALGANLMAAEQSPSSREIVQRFYATAQTNYVKDESSATNEIGRAHV